MRFRSDIILRCPTDLGEGAEVNGPAVQERFAYDCEVSPERWVGDLPPARHGGDLHLWPGTRDIVVPVDGLTLEGVDGLEGVRSEEHTSELQSLMRISYAVFCLKKKKEK